MSVQISVLFVYYLSKLA